jgi:hypothetical protein
VQYKLKDNDLLCKSAASRYSRRKISMLMHNRGKISRKSKMATRQDFHESYARGHINPPSERSTGLAFAAVAVIVAAWRRDTPNVALAALAVAAGLASLSLVAPRLLKPLNILWFNIGQLLHRIVNPLVMLVIFTLVFTPAGALMRLWYDPLRSRRAGPDVTYWIDRASERQQAVSMTNQF